MAVLLSPIGNGAQFFTFGGLPLSGGLLWTYQAGTSTPQPSYTTSVGNVANANPIVLGPDGRPPAEIWLTQGVAYKFGLLDSLSNPISSYDNILGINDFNNLSLPGTLTAAGNTTLQNLNVNGNTVLGDAAGDALSVNPSNVSWLNNPTHSGNHTFTGIIAANNNVVVGGVLSITSGSVLTGPTYMPTLTAVANVAASTAFLCNWMRIGDMVLVAGFLQIDPTAINTLTRIGISLPVASNFVTGIEVSGTGKRDTADYVCGPVKADTGNDRAQYEFQCDADASNQGHYFHFMYHIQ